MHLKILIGVLILGLATANPKAAPKPIPKPKPIAKAQFYPGYPGTAPNYFSGASNYLGQQFNPQPILSQDAARYYDPRFAPTGYQSPSGTAYSAQGSYSQNTGFAFGGQGSYPQPLPAAFGAQGNYLQVPPAAFGAQGSYPQASPTGFSAHGSYPQATPTTFGAQGSYPQAPLTAFGAQGNYPQAPGTGGQGGYIQAPGTAFGANPQASIGNFYNTNQGPTGISGGSSAQSVQPVVNPGGPSVQSVQPLVNPGGSSVQSVQSVVNPGGSAVQTEAARLWPKVLISPAGSPSPLPDGLARAYYALSTPSPLDYSTPNLQNPGTLQSPAASPQQNFNQPQTNYNAVPQNAQIPGPTPVPYQTNYQQQPTSSPYDSRFSQLSNQAGFPFSSTSNPYITNNQQPQAPRYPVNYQSTPTPFQINNQLPTTTPASPAQANYQSTSIPATQPTYQQQSSPNPIFPINNQPPPASYQGQPEVSFRAPFSDYQQPTSSPFIAQYQQKSVSAFAPNYQSTSSPYNQRIPVPVAYPQSQYQALPTPPTPADTSAASTSENSNSAPVDPSQSTSLTPSPSYPSFVPVTSKPITLLPTTPPPVKEVSIVENTFIPIPTKPSPGKKIKAKIIKSEYSGTVSPQYNHIPGVSTSYKNSTPIPFLDESAGKASYGVSFAPAKAYPGYYPSTAVSNVSFKSQSNSYSY